MNTSFVIVITNSIIKPSVLGELFVDVNVTPSKVLDDLTYSLRNDKIGEDYNLMEV
jgi:hypothetical protein